MKISNKIIALIVSVMVAVCSFSFVSFAEAPEVFSNSAILTDINSDEVLYQKGAYEETCPGVASKLMAIYTAINYEKEETVIIEADWLEDVTSDKPSLGLIPEESINKKDLIRIVYLSDYFDAYLALANHIGGSLSGFVEMMNDNAKKLGMVSTHYVTLSGYDVGKEYTTPYDTHILVKALYKNSVFKEISKEVSYTLNPYKTRTESLVITNGLDINNPQSEVYVSGSLFIKSEFDGTNGASTVFAVQRDNREILWISFGHPDKSLSVEEAVFGTEYAFSDFKRVIYTKEEIKKLYKGEKNLYIEPTADVYVTVPADVEKANLIATVKEDNRVATFKVVGNGVDYEKEVSRVKAQGLRFVWEGFLTLVRWILVGIVFLIVFICIIYIPVMISSHFKQKRIRAKREEKIRKLKEQLNEELNEE